MKLEYTRPGDNPAFFVSVLYLSEIGGLSGSGVASLSTCSSWANGARRKNKKTLTVIALC